MTRLTAVVVLPATALLLVTGCAAESDPSDADPSASASAASCTPDDMDTRKAGVLTIGTDQPVYEPWYVDNDPTNKKGFESAVAYAVAAELGYTDAQVKWTRVGFDAAIQPGPKPFDISLTEYSITEERRQAVDFSSPYYDVTQTVIAIKGSAADGVSSLAELKELQLGAQVGSTSLNAITDVVQPTKKPRVYNTNNDARAALENGQIDGLVVDLPTAFFMTAAQLDDGIIVGQLPQPSGTPEQFGILLDKGSSLTTCVSRAVDALRTDGTLDELEDRWLSQTGGAPVLQ